MKFHAGHNYGLTRITPYQDNKQYTAHRVFSWSRFPWNCWAFRKCKKFTIEFVNQHFSTLPELPLQIYSGEQIIERRHKWFFTHSLFIGQEIFFWSTQFASQRKSSQHLLRHKTHIWSKTQWQKTDVESALLMNVHIYKILTAFETVLSLICQVKL